MALLSIRKPDFFTRAIHCKICLRQSYLRLDILEHSTNWSHSIFLVFGKKGNVLLVRPTTISFFDEAIRRIHNEQALPSSLGYTCYSHGAHGVSVDKHPGIREISCLRSKESARLM